MLAHARILAVSVAAFALTATACATVPPGSVEAEAVECPEGSDCYDVPKAIGDGGSFTIEAFEFGFGEPEGLFWAGDIEVTIDNVGDAEHNIVVIGANEGSEQVQALGKQSATGIINLFEGDYVFFCSIPGHRAQGMEADLTVAPTQAEAEAAAATEGVGEPTDGETAAEEPTEEETGADQPTVGETGTEDSTEG